MGSRKMGRVVRRAWVLWFTLGALPVVAIAAASLGIVSKAAHLLIGFLVTVPGLFVPTACVALTHAWALGLGRGKRRDVRPGSWAWKILHEWPLRGARFKVRALIGLSFASGILSAVIGAWVFAIVPLVIGAALLWMVVVVEREMDDPRYSADALSEHTRVFLARLAGLVGLMSVGASGWGIHQLIMAWVA